jgi:hypothetical protein
MREGTHSASLTLALQVELAWDVGCVCSLAHSTATFLASTRSSSHVGLILGPRWTACCTEHAHVCWRHLVGWWSLADRHWYRAVAAGRLHKCDSVGRLVAWLALVTVIEGRMLLLGLVVVVLRRRRAVGMDIHDTGAGVRERDMNWLACEVGLLSQWRGETGGGMGRGGGGFAVLSAGVVMRTA